MIFLGIATLSVAALAQSGEVNNIPSAPCAVSSSEADKGSADENTESNGWAVPAEFCPLHVFGRAGYPFTIPAFPRQMPQAATSGFIAIQRWPIQDDKIQWAGLTIDSVRFLLFQQSFRLATEKDTRAGLSGPFFRDYKNSVLNIRGWNDGDPFFVNYIDHPMEGSVAGFLWIAHDPRSRGLEIGKSPEYWKSRMRAMAFAAAFSLQFEIGPISEASIGNIQLDPKKRGVVDWVITPVVGAGWMVGEDALDKYVVSKLEARTHSHVKRILLRGILNPSRSFANMMQGRVPWHRDTRSGVSEF